MHLHYVADIATPVVFHVQPRSDPDIALAGERLTSERRWRCGTTPTCTAIRAPGPSCRRPVPVQLRHRGHRPGRGRGRQPDAPELPPEALPDDTLIYTLPSRFCLPDLLGDQAWSEFAAWPGYRASRPSATT